MKAANKIERAKREVKQNYGLLDKRFEYIHSSKTDIRETFARFGWEPPSCQKIK